MKFYKPQVQLVRKDLESGAKEYFLHAITYCRRTNYIADGIHVDPTHLPDGLLKVTLNLRQDTELPDYEYITPVAHTASLGEIDFPEPEGWIEVGVQGAVLEEVNGVKITSRNTQSGSTSTVSSTDADDDSRPGGSGRLR